MGAERQKTILLVDDEAIIAMAEKLALEKYGYKVITANSGDEAVAAVAKTPAIDLVLMDINLGAGIDASEAATNILKQRDLPVVFLLNQPEPEVVEKTEKITSYGYIMKNSMDTVLHASLKTAFKLFEAKTREQEKEFQKEAALAALGESEEKFEQLFTQMPSAVAIFDAVEGGEDFIFKNFNIAAEKIEGLKKNKVVGKRVTQVFPGVKDFGILAVFQRVWKTGQPEFFPSAIYRDEQDRGTWRENWVFKLTGGEMIAIYHDITERKRTESQREAALKALAESEERYRSILNASPDGIAITDMKGCIILISPVILTLFGYEREEEVLGRRLADFITREDRDRALSNIALMLQGTLTGPGEFHALRRDGSIFDIEVNGESIQSAEGDPTHMVFIVRDSSERKAAEEVLAQERFLLLTLMNNIPDHVYFKDLDSRFVRINKALAKAFGLSDSAQAQGKTDFDFFTEAHARQAYEDEQTIMRTGQPLSKVERETWADRPDSWVLTTKMPLRDQKGRVIGTFGISRDITEQKQSDQELSESKAFIEAVVENAPLMIFLKEATDLKFVLFNRAGEELLGHDRASLIGKSDLDFFPAEQAAFFMAKDRVVLSGGSVILDIPEESIMTANKGQRLLHTRKVCIREADGTAKYLLGISEDITERKLAEEEIKRQLSEKEILLREVHHRIKNNIASIGGFLYLHMKSITSPEAVMVLQEAIGRVNSMGILYDKLLLSEDFKVISVKNYLDDLIDTITAIFPDKTKIKLDRRIDDFYLDPKQLFPLGIIINELLTNKMKYAFTDRDEGLIKISLKNVKNRITLTLQDNGCELPEGFDINGAKGFGLTLVKMLSRQLNGSFSLERHEGTRYTLEFSI